MIGGKCGAKHPLGNAIQCTPLVCDRETKHQAFRTSLCIIRDLLPPSTGASATTSTATTATSATDVGFVILNRFSLVLFAGDDGDGDGDGSKWVANLFHLAQVGPHQPTVHVAFTAMPAVSQPSS